MPTGQVGKGAENMTEFEAGAIFEELGCRVKALEFRVERLVSRVRVLENRSCPPVNPGTKVNDFCPNRPRTAPGIGAYMEYED